MGLLKGLPAPEPSQSGHRLVTGWYGIILM